MELSIADLHLLMEALDELDAASHRRDQEYGRPDAVELSARVRGVYDRRLNESCDR